MAKPSFDEDDEAPLDPKVARVEQRVRGLVLIAGLTLGLGLLSVFGAILYRIMSAGTTVPAVTATVMPAATAESEAAIRTAIAKWNADFNAGDGEAVCDLFAPDLRSFASGIPTEQTFGDVCTRLRNVLTDTSRTMSYALDIREVIVTGDTAIVRLTWTLTMRPAGGGAAVTITEQGMDYFREQPDGSWKIARFVSYEG